MTSNDFPPGCIDVLDTRPRGLLLRFPDGQQQRLEMPTDKATLGAGVGCAVPIRYPGVGPLHCVLFPVANGWRVRRWSSETLLNGGVFTEAAIEIGDRLQLGPVEVEFVDDEAGDASEPDFAADATSPPELCDSEPTLPPDDENAVFDYLPVAKGAGEPVLRSQPDETPDERFSRFDELERLLAECAAEGQQAHRDVRELRQQLEDVRHELAHAEQLHIATREAVVELGRQVADCRNTLTISQPARPKGFGISRRVWPAGLRRRLLAYARALPKPATISIGTEQLADSRTESVGHFDGTECGEAVCSEITEMPVTSGKVVESAAPPAKSVAEPESFFDKFPHLLKQEEPASEAATPSSPVGVSYEVPIESPPVESPRSSGGDDDDSIESYMNRLLQRVRGETSSSKAAVAPMPAPRSVTLEDLPDEVSVAPEQAPQTPARPVSNLDDIKAAPAPERSHNMAALRDLANQSARGAIQTSNRRQHRESAKSKLTVSLFGIICGIVVMKLSPSYTSPEFIGGLVPLFAGLVWGGFTTVLLLRTIRDGSSDATEPEPDDGRLPPDVSADDL